MKTSVIALLLLTAPGLVSGEARDVPKVQIVVVASENIAKGRIIRAKMLNQRELPLSARTPLGTIRRLSSAVGKRAKYSIARTQILTKFDVSTKPANPI